MHESNILSTLCIEITRVLFDLIKMNINQKDFLHISRIVILIVCIIYMNILSCGQNAFGGHANIDSTSDSEFIHISKQSFKYSYLNR